MRTSDLLHLKASFNTFWLIIVVLNKPALSSVTEDDTEKRALDNPWKSKLLHVNRYLLQRSLADRRGVVLFQ